VNLTPFFTPFSNPVFPLGDERFQAMVEKTLNRTAAHRPDAARNQEELTVTVPFSLAPFSLFLYAKVLPINCLQLFYKPLLFGRRGNHSLDSSAASASWSDVGSLAAVLAS
jgi:hypothetical protein